MPRGSCWPPLRQTGEDNWVVPASRGSAPSNRIWNITILRSRSSRFGSEPHSVEDDVDIWRYAILSCMPETTMTMWRSWGHHHRSLLVITNINTTSWDKLQKRKYEGVKDSLIKKNFHWTETTAQIISSTAHKVHQALTLTSFSLALLNFFKCSIVFGRCTRRSWLRSYSHNLSMLIRLLMTVDLL